MNLLFDLDGTLTDPREGILASLRHALSALGITPAEDRRLEACIGPPLRDALRELCPDPSLIEPAVVRYRERYASLGWAENRVYAGIPASLERLRRYRCFVATSKPTVFAERILDHFGLANYFDAIYGSELDGRFGDKTDLLAEICRRETLDPAVTVMIGDRKFDMVGAANHGMSAIGVLWGYGSKRELRAAGAGALCAHPSELADAIAAAGTRRESR